MTSGLTLVLGQNRKALDLTLTDADLAEIERLDRSERMIGPDKAPAWD